MVSGLSGQPEGPCFLLTVAGRTWATATHEARQPQGILAAFLLRASLGLGTGPYTKDADTAKSSARLPFPPHPTAGAQEGKDAQVGGGRSGWEDLPAHQLDKQP